ncbi:MFS transporter [Neobacillus cucumis]|uniref:MFS transporter n=1 Tax=Neobacillus cucumis TaxID=1740721 RepID=UPI00196254B5|nr:MFS transporter [Neobacillus cucumis]MBM7653336.1 MFS family permease [Neobacillus cucumis]
MWRNKNIWILLTGDFTAGLGLWLGLIGDLEFMQDTIPSDFLKSIIMALGLLAGFVFGPFAGRLTDRTSKKKVMQIAGVIRIISVLFMLMAISTGSLWWMVLFLVFFQISAAFYFPALQASLPLVADEKDLLHLNALIMNVSTLSRIIGAALGGFLLVILPLSFIYIGSLIAYIGLFILTFFLEINENNRMSVTRPLKKEQSFKEVFPIIQNVPIVFITVLMTLVPALFLGGVNLMVINISEIQDSTAIKGWVYAAEGISFMLGALFIKKINNQVSPYAVLFGSSFMVGLSQLLLYFANSPIWTLLAFLLFGFSVGSFFPTAATIFQTQVPKEYHGRFFSFQNMLDRVSYQIVLLLTGFLLDIMGLPLMSIIFGSLSIIMTVTFYVRNKMVILVERKSSLL